MVAESLGLSDADLIADLTCGMGNFFNFMPVESNIYGCEVDPKAYTVAHHLYPAANLELGDIRTYQPEVRFDYVVGNPPFNLRWYTPDGDCLSQLYYCVKAAELLKPLGILALVVPQSFLADSFADGTAIREMESRYSFLGQVNLPDNAFRQMGVSDFPTKLQLWQRKSEVSGWTPRRYATETLYSLSHGFDPVEEAKRLYERALMLPKAELEQNKAQVMLELARSHQGTGQFAYETQKLLYQIKIHPATKDKYMKCCEYLHRFYTQERPMIWSMRNGSARS